MRDKIVVDSFGGRGYCDNPKAIVEEVRKADPKIDICWIVRSKDTYLPDGIRSVKRHTLHEMYEYATAKIWINNSRLSLYLRKRKNQIYIETWHGSFPIKMIGKSAKSSNRCSEERVKLDSKYADYMISNGSFCTSVYRNDFEYEGEILEVGSPRLDILFYKNAEKDNSIRQMLNIPENVKVALYAPTFRDNNRDDVYDIDYEQLNDALKNKFGGSWCIIVRFHPKMVEYANKISYSETLKNGSNVADIYDLFGITDVLISDYSSTSLEFALLEKPVFLYTKDLSEYQKNRGLYYRIEELPFPFAKSNVELVDLVSKFSENDYKSKLKLFMEEYGCVENGQASCAVSKVLIDAMK
ncbi:MAG: CDP-glycerol glycerophosphotransferase family protein [Oscillospiraceae bacterium]|nr:CDP-glycerol glycerophosphotransferase family protein [Oscillospiraceae bacterium]